ncbi:hypothetical protein ANO14919_139610 [Xylariales sp. No.14919]|nr:hypothetical protein ANO14919_139610 [Xylariales sp. No.14919]
MDKAHRSPRHESEDNGLVRHPRKNTTRACQECRKKRTKCDGKAPSCSRCSARLIECRYSTTEDKRRPAPKAYVDLLRSRIEHLERILELHSISADGHLSPQASTLTMLYDGDASESSRAEDPPRGRQDRCSPGASEATLGCAFSKGALSKGASMNFDQDGEARYFGATSGRLVFKDLEDNRGDSRGFSALLNRFCDDLVDDDSVSEELEDHLIDLYFTWEHPYTPAVDEKLFRESRANGGKWYSPLLLNVILCMGSRFSDRAEIRSDPSDPNTAGRLFLEKAQVLLHFDLISPTITTVQALSILVTAYCSFGADAASWLHYGMALRLALDMGINFDVAALEGQDSSLFSPEEVFMRRQLHWTIYCIDKTAALYTGRICTYLDFQASVEMPGGKSPPCVEGSDTGARYPDNVQLQHSLVTLCQIVEAILVSLYAPKPLQCEQMAEFFAPCLLKLKNWNYDLPPNMRLDRYQPSQPPAVFIMHMIYHAAYIQLAKPFLARPRDRGQETAMAQDSVLETARSTGYDAARAMCAVARKYRNTFGSFRRSPITATHCTLSAALVLLDAQTTGWESVDLSTSSQDIDLCLCVLDELSTSWNPARRIRRNLELLLKHIRAKPDSQGPKDVIHPATSRHSWYRPGMTHSRGRKRSFDRQNEDANTAAPDSTAKRKNIEPSHNRLAGGLVRGFPCISWSRLLLAL